MFIANEFQFSVLTVQWHYAMQSFFQFMGMEILNEVVFAQFVHCVIVMWCMCQTIKVVHVSVFYSLFIKKSLKPQPSLRGKRFFKLKRNNTKTFNMIIIDIHWCYFFYLDIIFAHP